jgi:hypothetical protein
MIEVVFKIEKIIKIAQYCKVIFLYVLVLYYTIIYIPLRTLLFLLLF